MFDLQAEVAFLKSLKDMPSELHKILKRSHQTRKNKLYQCIEEDEGVNRKRNRSKVRRRDKSSEKIKEFTDINGALDRMQELEAQNELILLEH